MHPLIRKHRPVLIENGVKNPPKSQGDFKYILQVNFEHPNLQRGVGSENHCGIVTDTLALYLASKFGIAVCHRAGDSNWKSFFTGPCF